MGNRHILQSYKLGSIVEIKTGKLNSNAMVEDGDYPFFTCSREVYKTNTYSFNCECVLLAGNNAAGIYPIHYYNGEFDAYQRTYVIQSSDKAILKNRYLYYALQPKLELLKSISTGAATKFLTLSILNELVLELPSLVTQRKISAILSAYDDLIENNLRRIKILEEMAQNLYREWFVNFRFPGHKQTRFVDSSLGRIPEGWEIKALFSIADVTYGFAFKSGLFSNVKEGMPVIRIRDVLSGISNTYTMEQAKEKYLVKNGDILIGMDGDFHMGFWVGGPAYLVQRVARFRPKSGIGKYILFLVLQEPISRFNATITGTTVAHLGDKHLRTVEILFPDKSLLNYVSTILEPYLNLIISLRIKNRYLRQTRDILLPKLISGEVDVAELEIKVPEEVIV